MSKEAETEPEAATDTQDDPLHQDAFDAFQREQDEQLANGKGVTAFSDPLGDLQVRPEPPAKPETEEAKASEPESGEDDEETADGAGAEAKDDSPENASEPGTDAPEKKSKSGDEKRSQLPNGVRRRIERSDRMREEALKQVEDLKAKVAALEGSRPAQTETKTPAKPTQEAATDGSDPAPVFSDFAGEAQQWDAYNKAMEAWEARNLGDPDDTAATQPEADAKPGETQVELTEQQQIEQNYAMLRRILIEEGGEDGAVYETFAKLLGDRGGIELDAPMLARMVRMNMDTMSEDAFAFAEIFIERPRVAQHISIMPRNQQVEAMDKLLAASKAKPPKKAAGRKPKEAPKTDVETPDADPPQNSRQVLPGDEALVRAAKSGNFDAFQQIQDQMDRSRPGLGSFYAPI